MREAARSNGMANVWTQRSKRRRVTFDKRSRRPDGSLAPIRLDGDESFRAGE
jgi:hypothetical protein